MKIKMLLTILATGIGMLAVAQLAHADSKYEVWALDQSYDSDGDPDQGILHVFRGSDIQYITGNATETHTIDLYDAAVAAGFPGGLKPHMTLFNTGATHLLIGHASNGIAYAINANTKAIEDAFDMNDVLASGKSHAATPAPNNQYMIISDTDVADVVVRVNTNYGGGFGNIFGAATVINVSGNSICAAITDDSQYAFVTLAAGGLDIVDMTTNSVVHSYTVDPSLTANPGAAIIVGEIGPNGCGGLQIGNTMYINSGNPNPQHIDMVYAFDLTDLPGKPDLVRIPQGGNDSHGMASLGGGKFLWNCNRGSNACNVHDTATSPFDPAADPSDPNRIVNVVDLAAGGKLGADPAPDLVDTSPSGHLLFVAQRGPIPLSANNPAFNNAKGDSPGVGVVLIAGNGKYGIPIQHFDLSHIIGGNNVADIHALRVRK